MSDNRVNSFSLPHLSSHDEAKSASSSSDERSSAAGGQPSMPSTASPSLTRMPSRQPNTTQGLSGPRAKSSTAPTPGQPDGSSAANPWNNLPSNFQFAMPNAAREASVEVFKATDGRAQDSGREVKIAPFAIDNMKQIAKIIALLRTQEKPVIEHITNQLLDVHRSSGRGPAVAAIRTNEELQGSYFDLDQAAKQAYADKMGNCDRVNAAAFRSASLYNIKDPVMYYWTNQGNHNTCLVGDPRMPKYGEKNTIVMDAYPVFPMPHSLAEAAYEMRIPREGEEGHADLEIWYAAQRPESRFDPAHLPEPISDEQQQDWLRERSWSSRFGPNVVKDWHATEIHETGKAPDRWEFLFSCKDPSVRYSAGNDEYQANNWFPVEFVRQRVEAFLQLNNAFPPDATVLADAQLDEAPLDDRRAEDIGMFDAGSYDAQSADDDDVRPLPETGLTFQHVTPTYTVVSDIHTGEVLMEIRGSQIPVTKVNHGFPIKDPQRPHAIHPDYVSSTDPFRCHPNVKVGRVELTPEAKKIIRQYFPDEADECDYFAKRGAEIRAEYEAPLFNKVPPSAQQWEPRRLTGDECYGSEQAKVLKGSFGVMAIDYGNQNVGGMGPALAGAEIKTAVQRRQNMLQTSKAAFDNFSMRARDPKKPREQIFFAPYGGGNLAQFMNGKASPEEQAHFIAVDVIIYTTNRYGELRRVVAAHLFQIARVPKGKQAIMDYGDGYFYGGKRPGLHSQNAPGREPEIKAEPLDDEMTVYASRVDASGPSTTDNSAKRRPGSDHSAPEPKRHQSLPLRQALGERDVDSSSSSRASNTDPEDPGCETSDAEEFGTASEKPVSRQPRPSTAGNRTDEKIISEFPAEIWKKAQALAQKDELPTGVTFHKAGDKGAAPGYLARLNGRYLRYFEIVRGRDKHRAKALATAAQLVALSIDGGVQTNDEKVIARFSPDLWKNAQATALEPDLPNGVTSKRNNYYASKKIRGKMTHLGGFSVKDRGEVMAKALAIACRFTADLEEDEAIISRFPADIWKEAQALAQQDELPTGVTFHKAGEKRSKPGYRADFNGMYLGYFAIAQGRDKHRAKALAIAAWLAAPSVEGGAQKEDEKLIATFPPDVWERARARALEQGLPIGVSFKRNQYYASKGMHGKGNHLGCFAAGGRGEVMARALAIACRYMADREEDEKIISQFPAEIWEEAQARAQQDGFPRGVTFHKVSGRGHEPCYRAELNNRRLGYFSISQGRDKYKAKAMAIATLLVALSTEGEQQR